MFVALHLLPELNPRSSRTNPHWREDRDSNWSKFFSLKSLRKVTPVIEFASFVKKRGSGAIIDDVLHLQNPKWGEGEPFVWDPSVKPIECDFGTYPGMITSGIYDPSLLNVQWYQLFHVPTRFFVNQYYQRQCSPVWHHRHQV
jgi:hypothetical protein